MLAYLIPLCLLLAPAIAVWACKTKGTAYDLLDISPEETGERDECLYNQIAAATTRSPEEPLDESIFPEVGSGGTRHTLSGQECIDKATQLVSAINARHIKDWEVVEHNLLGIDSTHAQVVADQLKPTDLTREVKRLFWETARNTCDYEVVKWAIAIAGKSLAEAEATTLVVFARHSRFAESAVDVIVRESVRRPGLKRFLTSLMTSVSPSGLPAIIGHVLGDEPLLSEKSVQRQLLLSSMQHVDVLPIETVFAVARAIDIPHFVASTGADSQVGEPLHQLMSTMLASNSCMHLADIIGAESYLEAYIEAMDSRPADIEWHTRLYSAECFLRDCSPRWPTTAEKLERVREILLSSLSVDVVRQALHDEDYKSFALRFACDRELKQLLPDVEAMFHESVDQDTIRAVGSLGGDAELRLLLDAVPTLVDVNARCSTALRKVSPEGDEGVPGRLYAEILEHIGKLATVDVTSLVKQALRDYDPRVRLAACHAVAMLPIDAIDTAMSNAVRERLTDPTKAIRDSALMTSEKRAIVLEGAES